MDLSFFADLIAGFITFLFSGLQNVDLTPINTALETVTPFLKAALYILPAATMGQIFGVICAIWSTRLIIKTLQSLWAILPIA